MSGNRVGSNGRWSDDVTVTWTCGCGETFTDEDAFAEHRKSAGHAGRGFDVETTDEEYVQVYSGGMGGEDE